MARIECPDCDKPDLTSLYDKGNGRCKHCHGEGLIYSINETITGIITLGEVDEYSPCPICSKTGQCQSCGGEGFINTSEDNYENEYNSDDAYLTSSRTSYSSYSNSDGGYEQSSRTTLPAEPSSDSPTRDFILLTIMILVGISFFCGVFYIGALVIKKTYYGLHDGMDYLQKHLSDPPKRNEQFITEQSQKIYPAPIEKNVRTNQAAQTNPSTSEKTILITSKKAYFYNEPNKQTKRKGYLIYGDQITYSTVNNGFAYIEFTNEQGVTTKGWILLSNTQDKSFDILGVIKEVTEQSNNGFIYMVVQTENGAETSIVSSAHIYKDEQQIEWTQIKVGEKVGVVGDSETSEVYILK